MLNLIRNTVSNFRTSKATQDSNAFLAAAGITGQVQSQAIYNLVNDLQASGLWSKMKAVYPMVGGTATSMKFNLKDPRDLDAAFRLTWSGGWTYSATGATPNGTNAYANTNLLGNTNVVKGDFGFGIYSRTNINNNGAFGIDTSLHIYPRYTDTATYYRLFNGGVGINNSSSLGFIHGYNNSSFVSTSWYNSNKVNTYNTSTFNISSTNLLLGGNVPGAGGFDNRQLAFAFASQSLNDTEAQLLNQIVEKYQVALSRGVQAAQSFYYNSAYSNEANTYLYSTQITGTTQVSAINTLINGLKANNLWTKMKAVYPFVTDKTLQADMAAQMKFNLVNPQDSDAAFRLAFSGGWTYSTNGAQPNGTNGYADTKLNSLSNLTETSTSLSIYSRTNNTVSAHDISSREFVSYAFPFGILSNYSGTTYSVWSDYLATVSGVNTSAYFIQTKNSSILKLFRNNSIIITDTKTLVQMPNANVIIGAAQDATINGYAAFSNRQYAFATIGSGLNDTEVALLYSLVQQFQTDLTRQV